MSSLPPLVLPIVPSDRVSAARSLVLANSPAPGCICPVCDQVVAVRPRILDSGLAVCVVGLAAMHRDNTGQQAFHVNSLFRHFRGRHFHKVRERIVNFARLRFWGLIDSADPGWWWITELGVHFVTGTVRVPQHVNMFNARMQGEPYGPLISVTEALGTAFDLGELLTHNYRLQPGEGED